MKSPKHEDQMIENYAVLAALNHRRLRDGQIVDARAEGLLAIVTDSLKSGGPKLDIAGLVFAG